MIAVEELEKRYGDVRAVRGIEFSVDPGEVFGLVGPNGAGKTSTLKMIAGLVEPTAGSITVNGFDAAETEMRKTLGYLPEESPLYEEMTPMGYLHFFADLYDVDREIATERIESALDRLELEVRDRPVGDFSKGMKRKVAIARSLVNDPDVIVYDEPASGLDPATTHTVVEFTRELASRGKTVLFSAHDLYHVESVCDRVAIMHDGALAAKGTLSGIRERHGTVEYQVFTDVPLDDAQRVDGQRVGGKRVHGQRIDGHWRTTVQSMAGVDEIRERANAAGGRVVDIRTKESSLEELFLEVTSVDGS